MSESQQGNNLHPHMEDMEEEYANDEMNDELQYDDIVNYENHLNTYDYQQSQGLMNRINPNDLLQIADIVGQHLQNKRNLNPSESSTSKSHPPSIAEINSERSGQFINNNISSLKNFVELIPEFDGENIPVQKFIQECSYLVENTSSQMQPFLLKFVLKKITGKAAEFILHSQVDTLGELLVELEKSFSFSDDYGTILGEITNLQQGDNESVIDYAAKARKLLFKLSQLSRKDISHQYLQLKLTENDKLITKYFTQGLLPNIEFRVNLRLPINLQEAITIALEQEKYVSNVRKRSAPSNEIEINNSNREAKKSKTVNKIDNNRKNKYCFTCGKIGHNSRNCPDRAEPESSDNDQSENNDEDDNNEKNGNGNSSKSNDPKPECDFCKQRGHSTENCFVRILKSLESRSVCAISNSQII
ncbi:uncharacterized protein PFC0810c-like [Leptopilina boulardi]|uniref:uncharacterized protein PFC0810c-like n=1 Tax=Leptopilina boulardi TaxID=63433 RepID=UPI0021F5EA82|nr:uncharacterized protein PFC0810c-like [Leptopilina boulardi]XP_051153362.1 uncharacterized protein PFC0810c-like [Leptopilina boulardi]XP_051153363.1 uncharacterized protein PFC0810c-like [Leptopilina boulardi]XP_051158089.1 uncharacterized protein PFC0810c-like [Leptopilina boulardi]XP_051166353.1 uncharacterized protein PFC0810c-like [Leptopilina boulardi]XP_051175880.1 uncharacterized protein PFC0810c-like [Leptopilina boulardi]